MRRPLLAALLTVLALAAPAVAQEPEIGIGDPAAAAVAPVREAGARVGQLLVERDGNAIVATVSFRGRPPGRRVTLCVKVGAGRQQCVRRRPNADGVVRLQRKGEFVDPLRARTSWGRASGSLRM